MDQVFFFLLLLLLVLILRKPFKISDHCSELLGEIINTETEITKQLLKNQEQLGHYLVSGYYIVQVSSLCRGHMNLTERLN